MVLEALERVLGLMQAADAPPQPLGRGVRPRANGRAHSSRGALAPLDHPLERLAARYFCGWLPRPAPPA